MSNFVRDQVELYRKYAFPEPCAPKKLPDDLAKMRLNFMLEELMETAGAMGFTLRRHKRVRSKVEECESCPDRENCENKYPDSPTGLLAPCYEVTFKFEKTSGASDAVGVLDGLVDLQVVLLGTAYLMGFLREYAKRSVTYHSIFDEAWDRVLLANLKKSRGPREKRGHDLDLQKPAGWVPPNLRDLVGGWYGRCKDCNCDLVESDEGYLKCAACRANDEGSQS